MRNTLNIKLILRYKPRNRFLRGFFMYKFS